jgi:hypothetical protein
VSSERQNRSIKIEEDDKEGEEEAEEEEEEEERIWQVEM